MSLKYSAMATTQHAALYVGKRENVYSFQIQKIPDFSKQLSKSVSNYSREGKYHCRINKEHII